MSKVHEDQALFTAVDAVRDLMQKRLSGANDEERMALQAGLEELSALWQELQMQADALARERGHYLELFNHTPDPHLITDSVGLIVDANRAAAERFGAPQVRLVRKPITTYVAPGWRSIFRGHFNALRLGRPAPREITVAMRGRHDKDEWRASVSARAIAAPQGCSPTYCWVIRPTD